MLNLTDQEKNALVFLAVIIYIGIGVRFFLKSHQVLRPITAVTIRPLQFDLNKADLTEISRCRGVSAALAKKIISYRQAKGSFSCLSDLGEVKGIGPARLEKLKEYFYVE